MKFARLDRATASICRPLLTRTAEQLGHDAQLVALHASGMAPERAVIVLQAALRDIERCLARVVAADAKVRR